MDFRLLVLGFSLPDISEAAFVGLVFLFIVRDESSSWVSDLSSHMLVPLIRCLSSCWGVIFLNESLFWDMYFC